MCSWPHPYSTLILGVFPLHQIAHVGRQPTIKLFGREIIFEEFQPMWSWALASRGKNRCTCTKVIAKIKPGYRFLDHAIYWYLVAIVVSAANRVSTRDDSSRDYSSREVYTRKDSTRKDSSRGVSIRKDSTRKDSTREDSATTANRQTPASHSDHHKLMIVLFVFFIYMQYLLYISIA